jgi:heme oxygenase
MRSSHLHHHHCNISDFSGSICHLLRSATATDHAEVDARFAMLIGRGVAGYAEFLQLSAAAIAPLEEALRRLLATPGLQTLRPLRYLRHGEGLPLWPTFVEHLESSAAVRRSTADAIAGAHTAFGWFGAHAATSRYHA